MRGEERLSGFALLGCEMCKVCRRICAEIFSLLPTLEQTDLRQINDRRVDREPHPRLVLVVPAPSMACCCLDTPVCSRRGLLGKHSCKPSSAEPSGPSRPPLHRRSIRHHETLRLWRGAPGPQWRKAERLEWLAERPDLTQYDMTSHPVSFVGDSEGRRPSDQHERGSRRGFRNALLLCRERTAWGLVIGRNKSPVSTGHRGSALLTHRCLGSRLQTQSRAGVNRDVVFLSVAWTADGQRDERAFKTWR